MDEDELMQEITRLMHRQNINTSHIQSNEFGQSWRSKIWSGIKSAFRLGVPIVSALAHIIPAATSCMIQ